MSTTMTASAISSATRGESENCTSNAERWEAIRAPPKTPVSALTSVIPTCTVGRYRCGLSVSWRASSAPFTPWPASTASRERRDAANAISLRAKTALSPIKKNTMMISKAILIGSCIPSALGAIIAACRGGATPRRAMHAREENFDDRPARQTPSPPCGGALARGAFADSRLRDRRGQDQPQPGQPLAASLVVLQRLGIKLRGRCALGLCALSLPERFRPAGGGSRKAPPPGLGDRDFAVAHRLGGACADRGFRGTRAGAADRRFHRNLGRGRTGLSARRRALRISMAQARLHRGGGGAFGNRAGASADRRADGVLKALPRASFARPLQVLNDRAHPCRARVRSARDSCRRRRRRSSRRGCARSGRDSAPRHQTARSPADRVIAQAGLGSGLAHRTIPIPRQNPLRRQKAREARRAPRRRSGGNHVFACACLLRSKVSA